MGKYVVLTNKDTFQTVLDNEGLKPVETYHFYFFDNLKAKYTIAEVLDDDMKIQLFEEYEGKEYVNHIGIKFLRNLKALKQRVKN